MKAVRLHGRLDLRVDEVDRPSTPPPGFTNIEVRAAGICGSDIHNYRTGQWISRRPCTAGHEFCGRVTAVGPDVGNLSTGDLVVADSRFWCGRCAACRSGMPNICESLGFVGEVCDGGFAEEVQLPARLLVRHDPALNPRIAVLAEPLAVAIHAVRRLDARAGEPVLVVGCGTIGGLAALVLSRSHDGPIMVSDLNAGRADAVAQRAKATVAALDAAAISAALQGQRLRYAIDATGSPRAIIDTLGLLSGGGALVLVGISHAKIEIDPNVLVERETALVGCHAFGGELPEAVAMLPELAPLLDGVVDVLPALNDVPQAYDRLLAGGGKALKTVVELAD